MKYTYRFLTGESVGIEVSAELEAVLRNEDRLEYNNDHANTRRHISMNTAQGFGDVAFIDPKMDTVVQAFERIERATLLRAMESLTPEQKALICEIFFAERSLQSLSDEMGVSYQALQNRLKKALKRLKKTLRRGVYSALAVAYRWRGKRHPPERTESHMRHNIRIDLKGRDPTGPIVECWTRPLSAWLWRLLFGGRRSVVVLMPGGSVDSVNIIEQPEAARE